MDDDGATMKLWRSVMTDVLAKIVSIFHLLDRETQQEILRVTREEIAARAGGGGMPQSAVDEMAKAVPDKLMRDIVADNRRGIGEPGWLPRETPSQPVVRGTGWQQPGVAEDRTAQFERFDRMIEHLVGGPNSPVK